MLVIALLLLEAEMVATQYVQGMVQGLRSAIQCGNQAAIQAAFQKV